MGLAFEKSSHYGAVQCTGQIRMWASDDTSDYWYFATAADIASILPIEDKVHLIGSAALSADNMYSGDFTNTSPYTRFPTALADVQAITDKGPDTLDHESIHPWIRQVARDPEKTANRDREKPLDTQAPKEVILDNAWSVNRMVMLLIQAVQQLAAKVEQLEGKT
jgi:hypothetical protein